MKKIFRKMVIWMLKSLAKRRLKRFDGKVIGVTGSVGKTSTKEAIFTVLNSRFKVKKSDKSMNTEFGLPLTILEIESGYSSATKWSWYLIKAFFHSLAKDYNEIMLLELGVDAPGDMDFLTSIVKPDIAVVTNIFQTHLNPDQFSAVSEVFEEKSKLVAALRENGLAVLNIDDEFLPYLAKKRGRKGTITYGKDRKADYYVGRIKQTPENLSFILHHGDLRYEVTSGVLGEWNVYTILPAIICGVAMGMSIEECIIALERYGLPPGRMNMIPAIKEAQIIDSSYNSSPAALKEALKLLKELGEGRRKVAVLGNMNELGEQSEELHRAMGKIVPDHADMLITVGKEAAFMAEAAMENGFEEKNVFKFSNAAQAVEFFEKEIKKNDLILVKGSQNNVRLERFVKALMLHPQEAKDLLVRQDKFWQANL